MTKFIIITAAVFAFLAIGPLPGTAQQQQNANAYAYWEFGDNVNDVENVEQMIQILKPAPGSQWVMMWSWAADPAHGGYFGFNTDSDGKAQALFSLWNADKATGKNCKEFGGEGVGWSCRMPFELNSETVYKLRLARTKTDADGVWWGGWISEDSAGGSEYSLGEIRVKKAMNLIRGNSMMNFSEYYGDVVQKCADVPFSIFAVAAPQANRDPKSGDFLRTSRRNGGTDPKSNPCKTGNESEGNLLKVDDYELAGSPAAVIFLGGTRNQHILPKETSAPAPVQRNRAAPKARGHA